MTLGLLMQSAQGNRGRTLTKEQILILVETFMNYDALLGAYINEYGADLAETLAGAYVEGEVVDSEDETPQGEAASEEE